MASTGPGRPPIPSEKRMSTTIPVKTHIASPSPNPNTLGYRQPRVETLPNQTPQIVFK